jgi:hypothetical protein
MGNRSIFSALFSTTILVDTKEALFTVAQETRAVTSYKAVIADM